MSKDESIENGTSAVISGEDPEVPLSDTVTTTTNNVADDDDVPTEKNPIKNIEEKENTNDNNKNITVTDPVAQTSSSSSWSKLLNSPRGIESFSPSLGDSSPLNILNKSGSSHHHGLGTRVSLSLFFSLPGLLQYDIM